MKNKEYVPLVLSLIFMVILGACQNEEDVSFKDKTYPVNASLQRILLYATINDNSPISIVSEYEYDPTGKITKVSSPNYIDGLIKGTSHYDIYEYDGTDRLVKILSFNANLNSGFLNLKNSIYTYTAEGRKEIEYTEFPVINSFEYIKFYYENGKLVRKEQYDSMDKMEHFNELEYNQFGQLTEDKFYTGDSVLFRIVKHSYTNGLQTKSDTFTGLELEHLREVKRTFDSNSNLILLESNELLGYSSASSHVLRYEYFE